MAPLRQLKVKCSVVSTRFSVVLVPARRHRHRADVAVLVRVAIRHPGRVRAAGTWPAQRVHLLLGVGDLHRVDAQRNDCPADRTALQDGPRPGRPLEHLATGEPPDETPALDHEVGDGLACERRTQVLDPEQLGTCFSGQRPAVVPVPEDVLGTSILGTECPNDGGDGFFPGDRLTGNQQQHRRHDWCFHVPRPQQRPCRRNLPVSARPVRRAAAAHPWRPAPSGAVDPTPGP